MKHPAAALAASVALLLLAGSPAASSSPAPGVASIAVGNVRTGVQLDGGDTQTDDGHSGSDTGGHTDGHTGDAHLPEWTQPTDGDGGQDAESHGGSHSAEEGTETGHSSHGDETGPPPERPRALVLGSFAAVNGLVLLSAAFLRRRTRAEVQRRRSARAAAVRAPSSRAPSSRAPEL